MRGLQDKIALVTGAAGGIGRALCRRFAEEGAHVAALDISAAGVQSLAGAIPGVVPVVADITDHAAILAAVATVIEDMGRIDILVNNAGWDAPKPFLETTPDFWTKIIAINL